MGLQPDAAIAQIDGLLGDIEPRIGRSDRGYTTIRGTKPELAALRTKATATVERLAPRGSRYVIDATDDALLNAQFSHSIAHLAGVLRALRDDIEAGYLRSVEELIHAEVFGDFLGMADELFDKGYKDPAAVIAGSVLEEHLRKLAGVHGVAAESSDGRPLAADRINAGLAKGTPPAYNKLQQTQITAMLALRNRAAHGKYDEYGADQVAGLIRDVRGFLLRHPA